MIETYYGWGYFTGNRFISGKTLKKKQLPGLDTHHQQTVQNGENKFRKCTQLYVKTEKYEVQVSPLETNFGTIHFVRTENFPKN